MTDVLIIEDELDLRETLTLLLEGEGYTCVQAENGAEALAWLRSNPEPKVILLDVMMPVMDGIAFREKQLADARLRGIPTILTTAASEGPFLARRLDIFFFLHKPVDVDSLITLVGTLTRPMAELRAVRS